MSIKKIDEDLKKWYLNEATDVNSSGGYRMPLSPGMRLWDKKTISPFNIQVSKYDDAELAFDSYDGKLDVSKSKAKKMESKARQIEKKLKNNPVQNDEDGDILNSHRGKIKKTPPYNKSIKESSTNVTAGPYTAPLELGMNKWEDDKLAPFTEFVKTKSNLKKLKSTLKNNVKRVVGVWEKNSKGKYKRDTHPVHIVNEDLAVWFGTKKKPKGSKQPKGPWVNICRKKEGGGHPPCGRPEAKDKGYPKCRAAGVAAKMSDSQKKAACAQKRRAEKSNPKSGTGNKPKMVSYNTKKESERQKIKNVLKEYFSS